MKRSEMIEVIEVNISETKGQLNSHQLAERILKRIEQLGMLPPLASIEVEPTYFQDPSEISYIDNQWEPEDD